MKKAVIFIFLLLVGFWSAPHLAAVLFKKTLHAPLSTRIFWQEKIQVDAPVISQHEAVQYRFNHLGNPMRAYRGESNKCLIIGGSTYFSKHVGWDESFLNKLDERLGEVYFEPYVYESLKDGQAKNILEVISKRSERYDCVVIGVQPSGEVDRLERTAFPFWGQYQKYAIEPFSWAYKKSQQSLRGSEHLGHFFQHFISNENHPPSKREQKLWREKNPEDLIYVPLEVSEVFIEERKQRMKSLFKLAKKVAPKVYFISQPIAYSDDQHPDVEKVWWDKYKRKKPNGDIVFLNNKAVAEEKRFFNKLSIDVAKSEDIRIIDLDHHLKDFLQYPRQVYYDKWHLTEYGTGLAAEYVSQFLERNEP